MREPAACPVAELAREALNRERSETHEITLERDRLREELAKVTA